MFACVKHVFPTYVNPSASGTETITGVTDGKTGVPFAITGALLISGYVPLNTLTYYGTFDDSSYHWDQGMYFPTIQGGGGSGTCFDFSAKICSGDVTGGFAFSDTFPDIFFGGYIGGFGYISNVLPGQFDITWNRRDRGGNYYLMLCFGDTDNFIQYNGGMVNNTYGPFLGKPQGFITTVVGWMAAANAGPASTGAGGAPYIYGWASADGNMSSYYNSSGNQSSNSRAQFTDRFHTDGPIVSAWNSLTFTVANGSGGKCEQMVFCGNNVRCSSGSFRAPATDGLYSFSNRINANAMLFGTVGLPPGGSDAVLASGCTGYSDGIRQGAFWTGESTIGNNPLKGARYLSNTDVIRSGIANNALTTQVNIGSMISFDQFGHVLMNFTNTDGTQPEITWFAVGTDKTPQLYTGLNYINPDKLTKHDSYIYGTETKIPDPTIRSALLGS